MASGITSTARPTGLRLAGTVCVALGAIAAGVGATREWETIGFTADVQHAADVSVHGIDVWEGKVVLFAAVAALLVMLAMRISGNVVRERLKDLLPDDLRVEISAGLWITVAGGVLLVAGGVLGLVWVRRDAANATVPVDSDPG